MQRKLKSLYDLLVLRAVYNADLNKAIKENNEAKVKEYIVNYDGEDANFYNMQESVNMHKLQRMLSESEKEFEQAFATGRYIMGM